MKSEKLDKFYTSFAAALSVVDFLLILFHNEKIDIEQFSFLEPCAGSGVFLDVLKQRIPKSKCVSYDIAPEDSRIVSADFLLQEHKHNPKLISIGNPPFGHKGDLAATFINKCSEWGDIVVFVLPIQFRRFNIQKKINSGLKLIYSSGNFPKNSFVYKGKEYDVNCLFQVWVKRTSPLFQTHADLRLTRPLPNKHKDFDLFIYNNTPNALKYFNKDLYKWDFAVARQGYCDYSKRITEPSELKKNTQYLFVKYVNPQAKDIFDKMDFEKLSHTNTVILGFSNTDVVAEYERIKKES